MSPVTVRDAITDTAKATRMAEALKAMGHPVRLRILAYLAANGEATVGDLVRGLGIAQAVISQQLARLRHAGQVKVRPGGGFRHYSLAATETVALLECLTRCCEAALKGNDAR